MTTLATWTLKFGLTAQVITEETDRSPYVAPPLPHYEHDQQTCGCENCRRARVLDRKGVA